MLISNRSIVIFILLSNCQNLISYHQQNISLTTEQIRTINYQIFTTDNITTATSSISFSISKASLLFSIIAWNISTPIEQYEYFYSVNIQVNIPCKAKVESNITFFFKPSSSNSNEPQKRFFFSSTNHSLMKCENLTYGVHYTIYGYLTCPKRNFALSETKELYEIGKAKYINSTVNSTSIDTLFFLPGLFYRLRIELTNLNKTCSIEYSSRNSPFYHCSFHNLIPAQKFDLKYYSLTEDNQSQLVNETIVYTDLEDLNFSCQFNKTNQQIYFFWSNLIGSSYSNLTITVSSKENQPSWNISCDPYISQGICSTRLESGREYEIKGILKTNLSNDHGEKNGTCSVKTPLATVENLRIISNSSELKQIEVNYDPPIGSYDELILICEIKSSKKKKKFPNSTICTNLTLNESYRIYVETKRLGWESVNSTEIKFSFPSIIVPPAKSLFLIKK